MRQHDQNVPERRLIAGFAVAGVVLFAGTLLVGFSAREFDRETRQPAVSAPSEIAAASTAG